MTNLKDPISTTGVAEILGVTPAYVMTQRSRQRKRMEEARAQGVAVAAKPGDIPEPDLVLDKKPLWERATIVKFAATRPNPGKRNRRNS